MRDTVILLIVFVGLFGLVVAGALMRQAEAQACAERGGSLVRLADVGEVCAEIRILP